MTSFRLVLTWSSRLTVENLGVIGPGRSATAESSACQHPVKPKNVTTGISREDPSYCFNGSRLTRVNPCAGSAFAAMVLRAEAPWKLTADKSAGAERHALPRWGLIALWEFPRLARTRRGRPRLWITASVDPI